jgi:hypothetical protein
VAPPLAEFAPTGPDSRRAAAALLNASADVLKLLVGDGVRVALAAFGGRVFAAGGVFATMARLLLAILLACMCVCVYIYACVCVCVCIYIFRTPSPRNPAGMCVCVCVYICMCVCVCVCIHI